MALTEGQQSCVRLPRTSIQYQKPANNTDRFLASSSFVGHFYFYYLRISSHMASTYVSVCVYASLDCAGYVVQTAEGLPD